MLARVHLQGDSLQRGACDVRLGRVQRHPNNYRTRVRPVAKGSPQLGTVP